MKMFEQERLTEKQRVCWCPENPEENKCITETAGFIPLEVQFKRFEQAGIAMQFHTSEFTSSDYREMYLNPDFDITPEDDFEEVQEKLIAQQEFIQNYKKAKSNGENVKAGTEEPEQKKVVEQETE